VHEARHLEFGVQIVHRKYQSRKDKIATEGVCGPGHMTPF